MDVDGLPGRLTARLARGRAIAEARMFSRATLLRRTGRKAQDDEATGRIYPIWQILAVDVPLRVSGTQSTTPSRTQAVPGGEVQKARPTGSVPVVFDWLPDIPVADREVRDGDHLDVTSGETAGLVLNIIEADLAEQTTARRFLVEAVQRPEEWDL